MHAKEQPRSSGWGGGQNIIAVKESTARNQGKYAPKTHPEEKISFGGLGEN